jgi:hypothetical protein
MRDRHILATNKPTRRTNRNSLRCGREITLSYELNADC